MTPQQKIKRHGYHLMSLASLGAVCIGVLGFSLICMPWLQDWNPQWEGWSAISGIEWAQAIQMDPAAKSVLSLSSFMWTCAYLLPLFALRRLGRSLHRHEALSLAVANAFRWLAHSLLLHLLMLFMSSIFVSIASEMAKVPTLASAWHIDGFDSLYILVIACLCLYSVAHLMRLAVEAADDARSIV